MTNALCGAKLEDSKEAVWMDVKNKLDVLTKIAKALNAQNITWAVGASLLLYFKGIAGEFHDIDLMVALADADKAEKALMGLGDKAPKRPHGPYATQCFMEFVVDGVEVDVMAGFTILNRGKAYSFPLARESLQDFVVVGGEPVPLQSVKEWREYYRLMGRDQKVQAIDEYLNAPSSGT